MDRPTVYTANEWDTLRRVMVGTARHANWPRDPVFRSAMAAAPWTESALPIGPVDDEIVSSAEASLDNLAATLAGLGVEVLRPTPRDYTQLDEMSGYSPRDNVLIVGNRVILAPMTYPSRRREWDALADAWGRKHATVAPATAPFDAANVCRLNDDLLYLVSPTGSIEGAQWLQESLGDSYRVHPLTNIYSGVHIDSTIVPVCEGVVILNAERVNNDNMPKVLKNWDKIWITREDLVPQSFTHYPYASDWIGINLLMVNPRLAICDPKQTILRTKLKYSGIETIGVELPQSRTLGGGHHCVTLDLLRY